MKKNRTIPYGYHIVAGASSIYEPEAEMVHQIYQAYADGKSYKTIADALTKSGCRYIPDKPEWNKNIVARILQNQVYLGNDFYPPLLTQEEYRMAQEAKKPYSFRQAPELKTVYGMLRCGICGAPIKRRYKSDGTERWYCENDHRHIPSSLTDAVLLEKLQTVLSHAGESADAITNETPPDECRDASIVRLENEIQDLLDRSAENTEELLHMILHLAKSKYAALNGAGAKSIKIRRQLKDAQRNIRILSEIADSIVVSSETTISISLKNGQNISEGVSHI